jgi:hypothetical protein
MKIQGMASISLLVVIVSLVALLVVGAEGSGHTVFANQSISRHVALTNRGINVEKDTNQDQGCESAGGMSGTTNACTATSGPGSTETQVTLSLQAHSCNAFSGGFNCNSPICNNIGCTSISCVGSLFGVSNCTTNNGVQLISCTASESAFTLTCTRTETGTGISSSGGVTGG